jgi:hypothetical protein
LPWGSREAKRLGLHDELVTSCALDNPFWSYFFAGSFVRTRDLKATTPEGSCCLTLPHPTMQETLISLAEVAGAQILRGVALEHVIPGAPPSVSVMIDGARSDRFRLGWSYWPRVVSHDCAEPWLRGQGRS